MLTHMKALAYISNPIRTPIGKFGGALKRFTAPQLATLTVKKLRELDPESKMPDWVFMGHARQAGCAPNPARQATIFSGLPETVPAETLNLACASGMMAIIHAVEKIQCGRAEKIYAGGTESMSNTPYLLMQARWGQRMGHSKILDGMTQDGFHCPMSDMPMGQTVETYLAKELGISRSEQDAYALESQKRAAKYWENAHFKNECFSIASEGKNPGLDLDEHMRGDTTLESLAKLAPVFDPKNGSVTAGNSSGITDGAAFMCVDKNQRASSVAEILDYQIVALDPKKMGLGPVGAIQKILAANSLKVSDIEHFEINEAFAAQVIACNRELKIPIDRLNPCGGAIAIGHPIGATGARIMVTMLNALKGKKGALGIASLCVSGGHGVAVLLRTVK